MKIRVHGEAIGIYGTTQVCDALQVHLTDKTIYVQSCGKGTYHWVGLSQIFGIEIANGVWIQFKYSGLDYTLITPVEDELTKIQRKVFGG